MKKAKKISALLIAVMLVISCFSGISATAADTSVSATGEKTVYFDPGESANGNPVWFAWTWGGGVSDSWSNGTQSGDYIVFNNIGDNMAILRMPTGSTSADWNSCWNRTGDIDVSSANLVTFSSWGGGNYFNVTTGNYGGNEPTSPTNPTEPSNPTNPTSPSNPTTPSNPTNPTQPYNPDSPLASYYHTNANGVGAKKTITVDGDNSDWDSSMLIAQGTANDDPRVYRPNSMYENPIDLYALFAAYDDNNLSSSSYEAKVGDTISVKYNLKSAMKVCNAQWTLTYDSTKLRLKSSGTAMAPKTGGTVYSDDGHVYGNFSEVQNLVDFTSTGILAQAEFEVLSAGSTSVNLDVEELSVGYLSGGVLNYRNAVKNSVTQNLSGVSGFSSNSLSGTSKLVNGGISAEESLTVNADSNFFKSASTKVGANAKKVTVTYKLTSSMKLINSQWILTYDSSKLSLSSDLDSLMPNVSNFTPNRYSSDTIKGNFTNINLQNFSKGKDFVTATFDVIGTGTANVNLDVRILGIAYKDSNDAVEAYIVDDGKVYDVTSQAGFSSETYSTATTITSDSYVWGDVNLDGKLSIMDATVIQRYLSTDASTQLNDLQIQIADTNGDGKVTIMDATEIQRKLAGII